MPAGFDFNPSGSATTGSVLVCSAQTPRTHTNWNSAAPTNATILGTLSTSSGAQNDSVTYDIYLAAGTYTFDLFHFRFTDRGIFRITIDGASLTSLGGSADTIDSYVAAGGVSRRDSITGIVVPSSGLKAVVMTMATKNASSSSYVGSWSGFNFTKTA